MKRLLRRPPAGGYVLIAIEHCAVSTLKSNYSFGQPFGYANEVFLQNILLAADVQLIRFLIRAAIH